LEGELKDILVQIMEGQTRLESEVKKNSIRLESLEGEVNKGTTSIKSLKGEVNKNFIKLEVIDKKMDIIAEVQTAHKSQNERSFKNSDILLEERADLIETATKSISKGLSNVYDSIEVLKDMAGKHEVDIKILKRRLV